MINPFTLPSAIKDDLEAVQHLIKQRSNSNLVARINDVLDHILSGGGKRIRPILTLSSARLLNYEGVQHLDLAAAVEFVHTATLVHDDVVDESQKRRGKLAANFLWDNKTAVLVGDYLFARSFQLMVASGSLRSLEVLSDASATIAEAEVLQLVKQNDPTMTEEDYFTIAKGKTAALFSASTSVGGIIADGTESQIQALFKFGEALGIGFQIMDDLLDYQGAPLTMGKNVGDDFREGKVTLPIIYALKLATDEERTFWLNAFQSKNVRDEDLTKGLDILEKRGVLKQVRQVAWSWADKAKDQLAIFPDNGIKQFLNELVDFSVNRSN